MLEIRTALYTPRVRSMVALSTDRKAAVQVAHEHNNLNFGQITFRGMLKEP